MGFDFGRALNDLLLPTLLVGGGYLLYKSGAGERFKDWFSSFSPTANNPDRVPIGQFFDGLADSFPTPYDPTGEQSVYDLQTKLGSVVRSYNDHPDAVTSATDVYSLNASYFGLADPSKFTIYDILSGEFRIAESGEELYKRTPNEVVFKTSPSDGVKVDSFTEHSDGSMTLVLPSGKTEHYDKDGKRISTSNGGSLANNSSTSSNSSSGGGSSTTSSRHYVDSAGNIRLKGGNK